MADRQRVLIVNKIIQILNTADILTDDDAMIISQLLKKYDLVNHVKKLISDFDAEFNMIKSTHSAALYS